MPNFSKKIFYNVIAIIFLFLVFDFLVFYFDTKKYVNFNDLKTYIECYKKFYSGNTDKNFLYNQYILGKDNFFKPVINETSDKKPILLFGCSFVYGHNIPQDSTFPEVLGRYTKRPVYNRARHGFGVQQMLFQLEDKTFYDIIPQPEYIIYTFIGDHIRRMYIPSVIMVKEYNDIWYKKEQDHLTLKKQNKFTKEFICGLKIKNLLYNHNLYLNNTGQKEEFLKMHLLTAKKYVDENWPGTKFIILGYLDTKSLNNIKADLEKAGFIVINRNDIAPFDDFDTKYCLSKTDVHPNEKAWEYIVPALMREIEKY